MPQFIWDQTLAASCRKIFVTRLQLTANAWLVLKIACLHAVPWSLGCCVTTWGSGWYSFFRPRIWTNFCFTVHVCSCCTGGPCSHDGHLCSPSIKGTGGVPSKRLKLNGIRSPLNNFKHVPIVVLDGWIWWFSSWILISIDFFLWLCHLFPTIKFSARCPCWILLLWNEMPVSLFLF